MKNKFTLIMMLACLFQAEMRADDLRSSKIEHNHRILSLKGRVTSATGEPIPGVSVVLKGTNLGTISDLDGYYTITTPENAGTLIFSFIGFKTQEVAFSNNTLVDVVLELSENSLDEVVVVGYGTAKRGNIANSVSSISSEDLEERPINRIENAFSGSMAGVYAQTTSGEPGAELQVRVRGTGSVNASNEPLYVVDNIPVDNLRGINPSDVLSIDVLKDASAAAIYGSRGSNGVVLVTTKKGKKGKPKLNFQSYVGSQQAESRLPMMSPEEWIQQRKDGIDEAWVARGVTLKKPYTAADPMDFRATELGVTVNTPNAGLMYDPKWAYGQDSLAYVDWQKEFFRKATMKYYQLGASGGTDDLTYNISTSYLDQDGIAIATNLKRATIRANFEAKISSRIKFGLTLAPSLEWSDAGRVDGKDNTAMIAIQMPPVVDKAAGKYTGAMPFGAYPWSGRYFNPISTMERTEYAVKRNRMNASSYLNIDLMPELQLQLMGAMDNNNYFDQRFTPTSAQRDWATTVEGSITTSQRNQNLTGNNLFQSVLQYKKSIKKNHNINAILGYSVQKTNFESSFQSATGFPNDWSYVFNQAGVTSVGSNIASGSTALLSYFSRASYDYKGKYILSGSVRRDGSSKFGANKRWGVFPAISGAWRISDEGFLNRSTVVSDLKLRASWGVTGNNRIPDNAQFSLLGTQNYPVNNSTANGYSPTTIENLDLGWEQTSSINGGIDFGFFKNRILGSIDLYKRKTTDLLLRAPVSAITGFNTSWQNVGDVENKGVEFSITTRNYVRKDFQWRTNFNVSYNKNTVLRLGFDNTPIPQGFSNLTNIIQVGAPINSMVLYQHVGVFMTAAELDKYPKFTTQKAGDSRYLDVNGDGAITVADRAIVGHPSPDYTFGFTNDFTVGKFDLRVVTFAQTGGSIYSMIGRSIDRPGMGYLYNKMSIWKDRWQSEAKPGDGNVPSIGATTGGYFDTRWLYSSDYLRIKNITLGYNLPKIKGIDKSRVYVSIENAAIWHKYYGGLTPEASNNEGGDYGGYPQARTYTLGVNVTF
jgi:TonB-dependent starch-binding outer membrane protein SusC